MNLGTKSRSIFIFVFQWGGDWFFYNVFEQLCFVVIVWRGFHVKWLPYHEREHAHLSEWRLPVGAKDATIAAVVKQQYTVFIWWCVCLKS